MAILQPNAINPFDPSVPIEDRVAELLRNMDDPEVVAASMQRLRERVAAYERQYGIPSAEVHAAIDRGDLIETWEVCGWIFDYESLVRAESEGDGEG